MVWLVTGTILFSVTERSFGWSAIEALYFVFTSLSTIGLGDYFPQSTIGYYVLIPFCTIGLGLLAIAISLASERFGKWKQRAMERASLVLAERRLSQRRHRIRN